MELSGYLNLQNFTYASSPPGFSMTLRTTSAILLLTACVLCHGFLLLLLLLLATSKGRALAACRLVSHSSHPVKCKCITINEFDNGQTFETTTFMSDNLGNLQAISLSLSANLTICAPQTFSHSGFAACETKNNTNIKTK